MDIRHPRWTIPASPAQEFIPPNGPGCAPQGAIHSESDAASTPTSNPQGNNSDEGHHRRDDTAPFDGRGRDRHVPVIPALLIHGREAMENMIKGWRTWRACRPSSIGALLQDPEQGNNSIVPIGILRDWLLWHGWEGEDLFQ